jgi:hypothetical protein
MGIPLRFDEAKAFADKSFDVNLSKLVLGQIAAFGHHSAIRTKPAGGGMQYTLCHCCRKIGAHG